MAIDSSKGAAQLNYLAHPENMGIGDAQNLKSEEEILARQSRPQRSPTWVPKMRDWRYATGMIQHDDFEDAPKSRSAWDTLDYNYQAGVETVSQTRSRSGSGADNELAIMETMEDVHTSKSTTLRISTASPKLAGPGKITYKSMALPKGVWRQAKRLTCGEAAYGDDNEAKYETTGLIIRLYFTRQNWAQVKEILEQPAKPQNPSPIVNQNRTPPLSSPNIPAAARTADTIRAPHILDCIESLYAFPLFKRPWVDETYDFNVAAVRSKIRLTGKVHDELGDNYHWYVDAVPADAIFPPGVPISAKEISAFYPHHVRWKGVMVRLTNNDYRGPDIMGMQAHFRGAPDHETPHSHMNNYQRDTVKLAIPGFKTTSQKGKSDRSLRTDHLIPGPYIQSASKGYTLPSFEDLVRGLQRLPSGLDARGLTSCLSWYLNIRDTFTPKLELNVLHTQSLIRALREPLKLFGPQNLDRNALEEWRSKGTFESVKIEDKKRHLPTAEAVQPGRSQLHLNLDEGDASMKVTLPLRHVLTFPFLALHGVVREALKLGIEKAEMRQGAKKETANTRALEAKWAARATEKEDVELGDKEQENMPTQDNSPVQLMIGGPHRIPKRPLPVDIDKLSAHKKINIPTDSLNTPVPHKSRAATLRALAPAAPRNAGYLNRSWDSPASSLSYMPPSTQDNVYGRRDFHARQKHQDSERLHHQGAAYGRGASLPPGPNNHQHGWL